MERRKLCLRAANLRQAPQPDRAVLEMTMLNGVSSGEGSAARTWPRSGIYVDEGCDVVMLEGGTGDAACSAVRLMPKITGEATETRPNVSHLSRGARLHRSPCGTVSGRIRLM